MMQCLDDRPILARSCLNVQSMSPCALDTYALDR
jgi:hypothetical protein